MRIIMKIEQNHLLAGFILRESFRRILYVHFPSHTGKSTFPHPIVWVFFFQRQSARAREMANIENERIPPHQQVIQCDRNLKFQPLLALQPFSLPRILILIINDCQFVHSRLSKFKHHFVSSCSAQQNHMTVDWIANAMQWNENFQFCMSCDLFMF